MNKDAVYVRQQPVRSMVSIIIVNSNILPISVLAHNNIDKLREISDLFFVFSDKFDNTHIDINKFTNLYNSCAFIHGSGNNIGKTLFDAICYCSEVFQKHVSYIVTDTDRLGKLDENIKDDLDKILKITISDIVKPILNIRRLSTGELGEIYILPEKTEVEKNTSWLIWKKNKELTNTNVDRMNSTHKSESNLILFKSSTIKNLLNSYETEEFKAYINTFTEEDVSYLIASYIRKLGIENINTDLRDLKIGVIHDK